MKKAFALLMVMMFLVSMTAVFSASAEATYETVTNEYGDKIEYIIHEDFDDQPSWLGNDNRVDGDAGDPRYEFSNTIRSGSTGYSVKFHTMGGPIMMVLNGTSGTPDGMKAAIVNYGPLKEGQYYALVADVYWDLGEEEKEEFYAEDPEADPLGIFAFTRFGADEATEMSYGVTLSMEAKKWMTYGADKNGIFLPIEDTTAGHFKTGGTAFTRGWGTIDLRVTAAPCADVYVDNLRLAVVTPGDNRPSDEEPETTVPTATITTKASTATTKANTPPATGAALPVAAVITLGVATSAVLISKKRK